MVDKPAGLTSAQVVTRVKRLLPRGIKVGHAGTLDPFATGLLVLLVGKATRLCEQVMGQPKAYEATAKLGATTETEDPDSVEAKVEQARPVSRERIEEALRRFVGTISQIPPKYSAVKLGGKRASDRVRAGEVFEMRPREVRVYRIDTLGYDWPLLRLRIECGRGTYVRSIARDLGADLGCGGYLTELRRTRIGDFDVAQSLRLEHATPESIAAPLIDADGS